VTSELLIAVLAGTVAAATPLLIAGLGELVVERSGVLNLGIEGMMLVSAMTAVAVAQLSSRAALGIVAGVLVSVLLGALFAMLTVTIQADHVVTGLAIVVLGDGLSRFFGRPFVGSNVAAVYDSVAIPGLAGLPGIGPILFRQTPLVYVSYLMVPVVWYFLYRTRPGLALRATGERPRTVDVAGFSVTKIRYGSILFGSAMAGLAGGYLSLGYLHIWAEGMAAGRGWVALALVVLAGWHPVRLLVGAYVFGFAYIMAFQSQTMRGLPQEISTYIIQMFPYLLAILVLAVMGRVSGRRQFGAPAALAQPYDREARA
jgi:simple sugar transport system permease protein